MVSYVGHMIGDTFSVTSVSSYARLQPLAHLALLAGQAPPPLVTLFHAYLSHSISFSVTALNACIRATYTLT